MGLFEFQSPKDAESARQHYHLMLALAAILLFFGLASGILATVRGESPAPMVWMTLVASMFCITSAHIYRVEHRFLASREDQRKPA